MKDIPVFSTENGVASVFLREIPYNGIARVKILASQVPEALLDECVGFCRACGAEVVYASGDACLEEYPFVTTILQMRIDRASLGESDAMLFPMQEELAEHWCRIANERLEDVDNAAYLTIADGKRIAKEGSGYFVHRDGQLLGIGQIGDGTIELVVSVMRGSGADIVRALAGILPTEDIRLFVASSNLRAIKLYEKLGFLPEKEISRWYKIL